MIFVIVLLIVIVALGVAAILIDRINFPQRAFKPKMVDENTPVDHTGAHITIEDE